MTVPVRLYSTKTGGAWVAAEGKSSAPDEPAAKGSRDVFLLKEWLAADADARTAADASLTSGVSCDDLGCVVQAVGGNQDVRLRHPRRR